MDYNEQLRERITHLRIKKNISEHKMSLELGKSGSYIRSITNGGNPSVPELFNIIEYLGMTPADFFSTFSDGKRSRKDRFIEKIKEADDEWISRITDIADLIH